MPPRGRRRAARTVESQAQSQNNEQEQHQPEQSIPNAEARQTNLLLELIQGLQQTQGELAEAVRQLKEKKLLQQEREKILKEPRQFVKKPPYPAELLKQPYPDKYVTPTFSRFDGRKGSALVHVSKFLDSMGPYAGNGDLCLREFSKSLDDRAYTWYTTLSPGSVRSWDDMVEMFCGKYFQAEEKVTLVNLHGTKQGNGEDLLKYIHRSLNYCKRLERQHLSVKPWVEKTREKKYPPQTLTVSAGDDKRRKKWRNPTPGGARRSTTEEEKKSSKYCHYHRSIKHSITDCWTLRKRFHERIQDGTLELPQTQQRVHVDPFLKHKGKATVSVIIHGSTNDMDVSESAATNPAMPPAAIRALQRNPRFRSLFDQLGLNPEARTAATEAIMSIAAESGTHCFTAEAHASRAFLETTNAITFTDEDMDVPYPDHRRPLYLAATINEVQVRRALVDTGSCINLVPLSTLQAAGISQKKIQGAPMEVRGFGGAAEYTKGHIQLVLKVGPIIALTRFHVIDSVVPYHVLLGRPWLHKHQLISSTYHQCVKGRLNGKPIRIAANPTPFDQSESHLVEAALYDEITPAGEASLSKPVGTPLPRWEDIRDDPEVDLRELLERKKKRPESKEGSSQPSCYTVDEEDNSELADAAGKSAVTEETIAADPRISAKEELEVIDLSSDPNIQRPVSISTSLSASERTQLVALLKEYQDIFAWQYNEMPGIDPALVAHSLNVEPGAKPIVQPMRTFHPEIEAQISQEIFNKACPKDEFPLPNMDLLIDSAAGHAMFSFMDGFSGYNQILMSPKDAEKTAFRTPIGNFYYTVMPFGLKNAGATYQRTMTAMFHDMMHREIEDYVDDIVVKSKKREDHLTILRRVFERCRLYKLRMNPLKCAFGVAAGKFLGFLVHQRGIDVDPTRASAIASMKPPTTHKELKSFLGKLSYIRRFIPGLAAVTSSFAPLLKKGVPFRWSLECQQAFERVQDIMAKLPTVCAPIFGKPLRLYLASNDQAIGALIAQEDNEGVEQPVYYVSRALKDAETRYSGAERSCLALIYASQRLRHYFLAHKVQLMTKSHPIRSLLQRPVLTGRLAQWLLQLSQYEIIAETPTAIKSQAIADLLAQFPGEDSSSISDEVPGEVNEVLMADVTDATWTLRFDGSSTAASSGAGIVLFRNDGEAIPKSFKLDFPCSNNVAEYEAYLTGLAVAWEMGIKHLKVVGDSNLIVCQARGEFSLKEPSLAPYRALAQKLEEKFVTFEIEHAQRNENRYADALATLGSQMAFEGEKIDITINKKVRPITELLKKEFEELSLDEEDWRMPLKAKLVSPVAAADFKEIKDYTLISGELYRRLPGGILARCISIQEAKRKLVEIHEKTCEGGGEISLYRRLQRLGYYWPNMSKEAADLQSQCSNCQLQHDNEEVYTTFTSADWRVPFLEYFLGGILPQAHKEAYRLKRLASRYFVEGGTLFRKGYHGEPLRCLSASESQMVMKEAHADFVKTCHTCQVQADLIHTHPTNLQNMTTPWPFHTWGLDLIGPIGPASGGHIWILVATEYFTKWVEAISLRKATGAAVANFIREHIITRFGIPYKLISDNGTPFVNKDVRELLEHYQVKHRRSTPYYPQGNGQAEATNRMLLRILSKMVFDYGSNWNSHLADVLWAYRSSPKTATGFTPFSLVYGTDTISPTEMADLEGLDESRELARLKSQRNYQRMANAYSKTLQVRIFAEGQLVLKAADFVRRGLPSPSKFSPNWEGPYLIREAHGSGYYKLSKSDGTTLADPINGKWLKHYYS
uniref:RNA-directed DNA polymerase n=1 Tax=Fagus sylvatica TaxID=28930 RepID=A0A2N9ER07_FAGSY